MTRPGGRSGILQATAAAPKAEGHVVVADLDGNDPPREAAAAIGCDLRHPAAAMAAVEQTVATLCGLPVLVHSAGITRDRVIWKSTPEDGGGGGISGSGRIR